MSSRKFDITEAFIQALQEQQLKELADKKQEARSHKEDNEKAAPRTKLNKNGKEVPTRDMVDVSNPSVGNNSYKNQKGNQYWGTTNSEYASKRNKTGKRNEYGYDIYLADVDTMRTPVDKFQYEKNQAKLLKKDRDELKQKEKSARKPQNKEFYKGAVDNLDNQIDKRNQAASEIVSNEKDRIQNKRRSLGEYKEIKK